MLPVYETAIHNGIPVFLLPMSPLTTGTIAFGVGQRDEDARSAGIAHLIEHVVMNRVGVRSQSVNAFTTDDGLVFTARGDVAFVSDFLTRVSRVISGLDDLTPAEVSAQRTVIAFELGAENAKPGRGPLQERFGVNGLGLVDFGTPAHSAHGVEEVIAFSRTWLHAGNAAIVLTGPSATHLDVRLPPGSPREPRERSPAPGLSGWIPSALPGVTLTLIVGDGARAATSLAIGLIHDVLLNDLRHENHLLSSIDVFVAEWTEQAQFAAFHLDGPTERVEQIAPTAVDLLRTLSVTGADERVRHSYEEEWGRAVRDPNAQADGLVAHAIGVLRGTARLEAALADPREVLDADLTAIFASSLPTLLVSVDDAGISDPEGFGARLGLPDARATNAYYQQFTRPQLLRELSRPAVRTFLPRLGRGMRGHQVIVDETRVTYASAETGVVEVSLDRIVLAGRDDHAGIWTLVSAAGDGIFLRESDWRDGRTLGKLLDQWVPHDVRYGLAGP